MVAVAAVAAVAAVVAAGVVVAVTLVTNKCHLCDSVCASKEHNTGMGCKALLPSNIAR